MVIDYTLFPFRIVKSLALHLADAVEDWWHGVIAYWRFLEVLHGVVKPISYEELRAQILALDEREAQATRE